jgi:hypothetical protein
VALLDAPAAVGPQPVGDRPGDLALAGPGRADQPQERRARRVVHVEQCASDPVDGLAVQQRRVDPLAVGQLDRLDRRLELESVSVQGVGGEVALAGDVVDLVQGSVDRAHAGLLSFVEEVPPRRPRAARRVGQWAPKTLAATRSLAAVPA